MKYSFLSLVEQAYRLDVSDYEWYSAIAAHAARLVPGAGGAMAYAFDATTPAAGVQIGTWGAKSVSESFVRATHDLNAATTPDDAKRFYHRGILCGTVSELVRESGALSVTRETYVAAVAARGFADTFGLTASNPAHSGVVINSPLPRATTISPQTKTAWRQAGVHLHAAFRLRRSLRTASVEPEAVVDPERGVVHTEGDARTPDARERLRDAALAVDRARSKRAPDEPTDALEMWRGLVSGRWTLVESFESDRRRFFLAYPNEAELPSLRSLTAREEAVIAHVVQGDSNKWIAYQLGITPATVARHLTSALRKMGIHHRHELIWLYHSLHRPDHSRKSE